MKLLKVQLNLKILGIEMCLVDKFAVKIEVSISEKIKFIDMFPIKKTL